MNQVPRLNIQDVTDLVTVQYPMWQTVAIAGHLIVESIWFSIDPEPFEIYSITVKSEAKTHLPPALGMNGEGQRVPFESWIASVESVLGEELCTERKEEFRDYFLRTLLPQEAIDQDKADTEE